MARSGYRLTAKENAMRITLVPIRDSHNSLPSEMTSAVALTSTENESGVWLHVTLPDGREMTFDGGECARAMRALGVKS